MTTTASGRMSTPPRAEPAGAQPTLSEQRLRRLYDEYAAARRKNNEGDVRYETLASSIQKMLPDLSKKHQGKQIDFEVVLKDGRVGLKPKAT
jgi:CRISPR/Cas system CSM-associated protein Csm2 small subunit